MEEKSSPQTAQDQNLQPPQIKATTEKPSVVKEIGSYVMDEYIVPKSRDVLHDMFAGLFSAIGDGIQGALNKAFYGEDRGVTGRTTGNTNYNSFYRPATTTVTQSVSPSISRRSSTQVQIIFVNTEDDAKDIVNWMTNSIQRYGKVKLGDLYQSIGIQVTFQDMKYGWNNINQLFTSRSGYSPVYSGPNRGKFRLDLTQPVDIVNT